jgi:hypothetical protein
VNWVASRTALALLLTTSGFALLASQGCALPVVSAGNFLPAGDLQPGEFHASVSIEAARVLAGPSDVRDLSTGSSAPAPIPNEAQQWQVSTWFASDITLRYQLLRRVTLEGQLKLTNPITPFEPNLVGGALGVRVRILERGPEKGFAAEIGFKVVGISAQQTLDRTAGDLQQTDTWNYRAFGAEVPLIVTYRVNSLMAVTASPFLRAYYIRAWHNVDTVSTHEQTILFYTPVLSGGLGVSFAFDLGPLQLAPGLAMELATRPGDNANTHVLFEPGISVGTHF